MYRPKQRDFYQSCILRFFALDKLCSLTEHYALLMLFFMLSMSKKTNASVVFSNLILNTKNLKVSFQISVMKSGYREDKTKDSRAINNRTRLAVDRVKP